MREVSEIVMFFDVVALFPEVLAFNLFLMYYCKDNRSTRYNLILACALMVLGNVIQYTGIIIGSILDPNIPTSAPFSFLLVNGLAAIIYWYFRYICVEWHTMSQG